MIFGMLPATRPNISRRPSPAKPGSIKENAVSDSPGHQASSPCPFFMATSGKSSPTPHLGLFMRVTASSTGQQTISSKVLVAKGSRENPSPVCQKQPAGGAFPTSPRRRLPLHRRSVDFSHSYFSSYYDSKTFFNGLKSASISLHRTFQ